MPRYESEVTLYPSTAALGPGHNGSPMLETEPISYSTDQEESQHSVDWIWPWVRIAVLGGADAWGKPVRNLDKELKVNMAETHSEQRPEPTSAALTNS